MGLPHFTGWCVHGACEPAKRGQCPGQPVRASPLKVEFGARRLTAAAEVALPPGRRPDAMAWARCKGALHAVRRWRLVSGAAVAVQGGLCVAVEVGRLRVAAALAQRCRPAPCAHGH